MSASRSTIRSLALTAATGILLVASGGASAAPVPFGIDMGGSCEEAVHGTDRETLRHGAHRVTGGEMVQLARKESDMANLQFVMATCKDTTGEAAGLAAVSGVFKMESGDAIGQRFAQLDERLSEKYESVRSSGDAISETSSRSAWYKAGNNVQIQLYSQGRNYLVLSYARPEYLSAQRDHARQQAREAEKTGASTRNPDQL